MTKKIRGRNKRGIRFFLICSAFLKVTYPAFAAMEDINPSVCILRDYYDSNKQGARDLLYDMHWGSEMVLMPKFIAINLDPMASIDTKKYSETVWLITIYTLATDIAARNGVLKSLTEDSELLKFFGDLSEGLEAYAALSKSQRVRQFLPLAEEVGKKARDELVRRGVYTSTKATESATYMRLGKSLAAAGLFFAEMGDALDGVNKNDKAEFLAAQTAVWLSLENDVVPIIKKTDLYETTPSLRSAIENLMTAPEAMKDLNFKQFVTNSLINVAAFVVGLKLGAAIGTAVEPGLGTVAGALIGAAVGLLVQVVADFLKEGGDFVLYNDVASRLFTLSLMDDSTPGNAGDAFIKAYTLYLGFLTLKEKVLGKGSIQKVGQFLAFIGLDTEEKKWNDLITKSFSTREKISLSVNKTLHALDKYTPPGAAYQSLMAKTISCPKTFALIALDLSGSMGDTPENPKFSKSKDESKQVIKTTDPNTTYVGMVLYSSFYSWEWEGKPKGKHVCSASDMPVWVGFTTDKQKALSAIDDIPSPVPEDLTPMKAGLEKSYDYIAKNLPDDVYGCVVLIADGQQNCPHGEDIPALRDIEKKVFYKGNPHGTSPCVSVVGLPPFSRESFSQMFKVAKEGHGKFHPAFSTRSFQSGFQNIVSFVKDKKSFIENEIAKSGIVLGALLLLLLPLVLI